MTALERRDTARRVAFAALLNLVLCAGELAGGFAGHSLSLLLDAVHNLGDAGASLAPLVAGLVAWLTGYSIFDPLLALGVAGWILFETWREVRGHSHSGEPH